MELNTKTSTKNKLCVGLLAHVDAGKTTLAEAILYESGTRRFLGRVDHGSAFLDTFELERQRGITIFSKQAELDLPKTQVTLIDTPGHTDFSSEMERTLDILDCAVMIISATSGIQSHTITVWNLLREKQIPTIVFINKMDLPGIDPVQLAKSLRELDPHITELSAGHEEEIALCSEPLLNQYLETGALSEQEIYHAFQDGTLFPMFFGSALKLQGVDTLCRFLDRIPPLHVTSRDFAGRVYKISRDEQGVRLTHIRLTGGTLSVRQSLSAGGQEQKITQIRIYSGAKYQAVEAIGPGDVAALAGLDYTFAGMGLGCTPDAAAPTLNPVLTYQVCLPESCDIHTAYSYLTQLEEEDPQLHVVFHSGRQELCVQIMGPVQLDVLAQLLLSRFGLDVSFGQGSILYRETISAPVEGVGHFEPLRHYAEVHLLLEPGEPGSGLVFSSACSLNELDRNWQRLILTHLAEKQHLGVLTGSPITDMHITLMSGRAHLKHTEGGDFREATYRAVRQGLMSARSILLEPVYRFRLQVPSDCVGRAMTDLQNMGAALSDPVHTSSAVTFTGTAAVRALQDYPITLAAYTHGLGTLSLAFSGYAPCGDQDTLVPTFSYNPEADLANTPDSIFCQHGAGKNIKWSDVPAHMHLPSIFQPQEEPESREFLGARYRAMVATDKELMAIFERTYGPIRQNNAHSRPVHPAGSSVEKKHHAASPPGPEYVLIDGYNVIFAWTELRELASQDLEAARNRLIDILRNYQSFRQCPVILVFDAYKVKGNPGSVERYGGLSVVFTKEAQTADAYIEKLSYDLGKKHRVRVVTSDGAEQVIILGHGALREPAGNFELEVLQILDSIRSCLSV